MESTKYKNLRTLLQWDRAKAKETIESLQADSEQVVADIEDEMMRLHGYKWKVSEWFPLPHFIGLTSAKIWIGFHAVPSME